MKKSLIKVMLLSASALLASCGAQAVSSESNPSASESTGTSLVSGEGSKEASQEPHSEIDSHEESEEAESSTGGEEISSLPVVHTFSDPTYVWADDNSTCTATMVCLDDESLTVIETVPARVSYTIDPTCEEDGLADYFAEFENEEFEDQSKTGVVIPAIGHEYYFVDFVWDTSVAGQYTAKAKYVCEHDEEHVELYDAEVDSIVMTEPTCESAGERKYTATFDGFGDSTTEVIAPLGHEFGSVTYTWNDDKTECTATRTCEHDSSHVEAETVEATSNVTTAATCTSAGAATRTATFQNPAFEAQTADVVIPAIGHEFGSVTYTWNDDKTECTATRTCEHDSSHVETETVQATSNVTTAATCTSAGAATRTATFQNPAFETQTANVVIPSIGHNYEITYTWSDDYSSVTATATCKNDASHVVTETAATSYGASPADYDEYTVGYTAEFETEIFDKAQLDDFVLTPTFKNPDEYSIRAARTDLSGSITIKSEYGEDCIVAEIQDEGFESCSGLTEVSLPSTLRAIGREAFAECYSLEEVTLSSGLTTIGEYAFDHCENLSFIQIPNTVTSIGEKAFQNCESLTRISLPEGIDKVPLGCFWQCTHLETVFLPSTITLIEDCAFRDCYNLESINYLGSKNDWNAIEKIGNWADGVSHDCVVSCLDGEIVLDD